MDLNRRQILCGLGGIACGAACAGLINPKEDAHAASEKRFFSFFGENWGCPGLPFPFTPCGFHRDPGGTEGSGNEHQDPPQL